MQFNTQQCYDQIMMTLPRNYKLSRSFDDRDLAQMIANYLMKVIPFCADYGVDVLDTSDVLPEGIDPGKYSARYILLTHDSLKEYSNTQEHIYHCITDLYAGINCGLELAAVRKAAEPLPVKSKKRMCPQCRSFKNMTTAPDCNGEYVCTSCELRWYETKQGGMLYTKQAYDTIRTARERSKKKQFTVCERAEDLDMGYPELLSEEVYK